MFSHLKIEAEMKTGITGSRAPSATPMAATRPSAIPAMPSDIWPPQRASPRGGGNEGMRARGACLQASAASRVWYMHDMAARHGMVHPVRSMTQRHWESSALLAGRFDGARRAPSCRRMHQSVHPNLWASVTISCAQNQQQE